MSDRFAGSSSLLQPLFGEFLHWSSTCNRVSLDPKYFDFVLALVISLTFFLTFYLILWSDFWMAAQRIDPKKRIFRPETEESN
ncbi:unnamed protein product [Caenorhabditis sp. 36 PRJEB53466]|nr:unnamed protein product [Caenorhabditis sp. 36 PRJEB53466]